MKNLLAYSFLSFALFTLPATAYELSRGDFIGECVAVTANYENAAPTKCSYWNGDGSSPAPAKEETK